MKSAHTVSIHKTAVINCTRGNCFNYIVPVSLPHIFKRFLLIPAVVSTNETERWFRPGLTRTVYFSDGSSAQETLTAVTHPKSFSYTIVNFTGLNGLLIDKIEGVWNFTDRNDATNITWKYTIFARNIVGRSIIACFAAPMMRQALTRALVILKTDLER